MRSDKVPEVSRLVNIHSTGALVMLDVVVSFPVTPLNGSGNRRAGVLEIAGEVLNKLAGAINPSEPVPVIPILPLTVLGFGLGVLDGVNVLDGLGRHGCGGGVVAIVQRHDS